MGLHHDVANNEPPAAAHCCKHSGEELMPAPEKAAWTGLTHSKSIASTAHYGCAKFASTQQLLALKGYWLSKARNQLFMRPAAACMTQ